MLHRHTFVICARAVIAGLLFAIATASWSIPTAIVYQGKLTDAGNPATGSYDMRFSLYDSAAVGTGSKYGATLDLAGVVATAGIFTATLDFGNVFSVNLYLQVEVRPAGNGAYTTLAPRQAVTASPYSLQTVFAVDAQFLNGLAATRYLNTDSAGNVGLGTAGAPQGKMHIVSPSTQGPPRVESAGNTAATGAGWDFYHGALRRGFVGVPDNLSAVGPGEMILYGTAGLSTSIWGGGIRALTVSSQGNVELTGNTYLQGTVGVGTAPTIGAKLTVLATDNIGVHGTSIESWAVSGESVNGAGIRGKSETYHGVVGTTTSGAFNWSAVRGINEGAGAGVHGTATTYIGVLGESSSSIGVYGGSYSNHGVYGKSTSGIGVYGDSSSAGGYGVYARNTSAGKALYVEGTSQFTGTITKPAGSFKIDHPLDPERKYLSHSFVESPDMMNIYNGNITTDGAGRAVVELPEWIEALNRDFRYQLTVIGPFAQAVVADEVRDHRFAIATSAPNVKVSWQVTGIRRDAYAEQNRIPVEEAKPADAQGTYLHPAAFGRPEESGEAYRMRR